MLQLIIYVYLFSIFCQKVYSLEDKVYILDSHFLNHFTYIPIFLLLSEETICSQA